MIKSHPGNYFEDFRLGQVITHATPRTVTAGDVSLYTALYGSRFAVQSSDHFARAIGYRDAPVDDLLVFNIVFGKTVPDISLNAVANLGPASSTSARPGSMQLALRFWNMSAGSWCENGTRALHRVEKTYPHCRSSLHPTILARPARPFAAPPTITLSPAAPKDSAIMHRASASTTWMA